MSRRREVAMLPKALSAWRGAKGQIDTLASLARRHGASEEEIAEALRSRWTQRELSDMTAGAVSAQLIGMIEAGDQQPRRPNADDIAAALGVPVEAIAFVYPDPMVDTAANGGNGAAA